MKVQYQSGNTYSTKRPSVYNEIGILFGQMFIEFV